MKFSKKSQLMIIPAMLASFGALSFSPAPAEAWTDQTHMAIEQKLGRTRPIWPLNVLPD